jgi:ParB-like chromosome segregation protein Spo0J
MEITTKKLKLSQIKPNPTNPRKIGKVEMERLVKSLQDFPEMLELREIIVDENNVILGGNMRYRALKQIGEKECVAKIVTGLTPDQKREFVIKDNGGFGTWDFDLLANSWADLPLADFGIDLPEDWLKEPPEIQEDQSESKSDCQQNECPKCGYKWNANEQV